MVFMVGIMKASDLHDIDRDITKSINMVAALGLRGSLEKGPIIEGKTIEGTTISPVLFFYC